MHAWAEVRRLLWNSKSVLTDFLSKCMQYWLKNHWPDQALFKHSLHTNCNSNSAILHNNYISLLSDLWAYVHVKKNWCCKGSHSSSVSASNRVVWLQTWKKWWAGALLSEECCCFVRKPSWESCKFELARLKKKGSCRISDSLVQTKGGMVYRHVMPRPPNSHYATPSYNMYTYKAQLLAITNLLLLWWRICWWCCPLGTLSISHVWTP